MFSGRGESPLHPSPLAQKSLPASDPPLGPVDRKSVKEGIGLVFLVHRVKLELLI